MTERRDIETTESEVKSPQECPHCGAFYDNADSFKDHVEQHEREGTNDNSEKDRQNQEYPDGWQDEYKTEMKGEERETPKEKEDRKWRLRKKRMAWQREDPSYKRIKDHESKASETFYDQAKWLAKAKLEAGGLDIASALPDIIRSALGSISSLDSDFDEEELSRAIEDAIEIYKTSLETGMSMWGNIKSSETEPKLDTEEDIDDYIKEGTDPAPYNEEEMPETIKQEIEDKEKAKERSKADIQAMKDLGAGDFAGDIPDDMSVDQWLGGDDNEDKDEAEEIIGALAINDELEGMKDTYGSSANADDTTQPLEDHSGTDDSSDAITEADTEDEDEEDLSDQPHHKFGTIEESFGDCGCKDTKKAKMTWETATESDKQYWLRDMGEDEGYSYYYFEHLPKRVGESLVNKFKVEESEDRGWSKIPALERADLLKKLGFPPRDAELVANLEYPQLSESLKKDVDDAVSVKKKAEESQKEKPDEQLAFENDLYSNMYDGYLKRRGQRVDSKKN